MPFILGIRVIVAQPLPSEAAKITVKSRLAAACDVLRQRLQNGNSFRAPQEIITCGLAR